MRSKLATCLTIVVLAPFVVGCDGAAPDAVQARERAGSETAMDRRIEEALDRLEIQNVLWTYARGVDRSDYEAMAGIYHPEATDHHSTFNGLGTDFARQVTSSNAPIAGQHHITNIQMQFQGVNDARVESYFLAFHPHASKGVYKLAIAAGRYLDHFQRRNGAWKVLTREVVMDWTRDSVDGPPWEGIDGKPFPGKRLATGDRSYEFFAGQTEKK